MVVINHFHVYILRSRRWTNSNSNSQDMTVIFLTEIEFRSLFILVSQTKVTYFPVCLCPALKCLISIVISSFTSFSLRFLCMLFSNTYIKLILWLNCSFYSHYHWDADYLTSLLTTVITLCILFAAITRNVFY